MYGTITVLITVLMIALGIMHHEYGHMVAAVKRGVEVPEYCIGMGPKIWSKTSAKTGRKYSLALFPIGGYCELNDKQLDNASTKDYVSVLSAGFVRNFVDGFLLIGVGKFVYSGATASILAVLKTALLSVWIMIAGTFQALAHIFDLRMFAEEGGMITSLGTMAESVSEMNPTMLQAIGYGLIFGGAMNIVLAIFNALPIPAIDGGQIVTRFITDFIEKVLKKEPNRKLIARINMIALAVLMAYQGIVFLFDSPLVRDFAMKYVFHS